MPDKPMDNLLLTDEEIAETCGSKLCFIDNFDRAIAKAQLAKCEKAIEKAKRQERERMLDILRNHQVTTDIDCQTFFIPIKVLKALKETK